MDIHILCFSAGGEELARKLQNKLLAFYRVVSLASARKDCEGIARAGLSEWTEAHFRHGNALVFVGSCGIAVRGIAPFVADKAQDPAVLVIDEKGRFVIPLLSGHIGGANALARKIAPLTGGTAVLTTATDVQDLLAIDVLATENGLHISDMALAKAFSSRLLATGKAALYIPPTVKEEIIIEGLPPPELELRYAPIEAIPPNDSRAISCISPFAEKSAILNLIPPCLVLGIGCRKGKSPDELAAFVGENLAALKLSPFAVRQIASVDVKRDEAGLIALAERYRAAFTTFSAEVLRVVPGDFASSAFVERSVGVDNVCERAAVAAGAERLLLGKTVRDGMTLAIGIAKYRITMGEQ